MMLVLGLGLGLGLALDLDCPGLVNTGLLISFVIQTPKDRLNWDSRDKTELINVHTSKEFKQNQT